MWTILAVQVGLAIVGATVTYFLRDDDSAKQARGDFGPSQNPYPIVTESDTIPIVFGGVRLTAPNVLWYTGPHPSSTPNASAPDGTESMLLLLAWCHGPVDEIGAIYLGNHDLQPDEDSNWLTFPIEYSVEGHVLKDVGFNVTGARHAYPYISGDFWFGTQTDINDWPTNRTSWEDAFEISPSGIGFRGLLLFAGHMFIAAGAGGFEPLALDVVRRQVLTDGAPQWYAEKANVGADVGAKHDINPIHVIRECLVDTVWGRGESVSKLDDAAFKAAADILHNEWFGIAGIFTRERPIADWIGDILEVIDGELYTEPTTGKITIKLMRNDYDVESVPVLTDSNSSGTFTRPSPHELVSRVTINYQNIEENREASYTLTNTAAYAMRGEINHTKSCNLITNVDVAALLAARMLRQLSTPLARVELTAHRSAAKGLRKGDVFIWSSADQQVELTCRVASINFGTPTNQEITIEAIEDAFAYEAAFDVPPPSTWEDPWKDPEPATPRLVFELPLWLRHQLDLERDPYAHITDHASSEVGVIGFAAGAPNRDAQDYDLFIDGHTRDRNAGFTPFLTTKFNVEQTDTTIAFIEDAPFDAGADAFLILQIGDELIVAESWNGNSATVCRGWADTVPTHTRIAAGTPVAVLGYVYDNNTRFTRLYSVDQRALGSATTHDVQALVRTTRGRLQPDDAPVDQLTIGNGGMARALRPLVPTRLRAVNGVFDTFVTWVERDRLKPAVCDSATDVEKPTDPVTYTLKIYGTGLVPVWSLLRTVSGLTGDGYTYPHSLEKSDRESSQLAKALRFELTAYAGLVPSWQTYIKVLTR